MNTLSIQFCTFAVIAFFAYYLSGLLGRKVQNSVSIALGLTFIGYYDYRFAALLFAVSIVAYLGGFAAAKWNKSVYVSVPLLASSLFLFKYYDFFVGTFGGSALKLILPLGISFYTFMAIGYVIDVAKGKIAPEKSPLDFFAFMTFFPQITAGPIGRADKLLPQFKNVRAFDYELAAEGCRQVLWGAMKKMLIADCLGKIVSPVFANVAGYSTASLWIAAFLYSIQIYADFSGYTDIALGIAKVFGVRLMKNFDNPYFATTVGDFWRRWHISLTTWFRDYIYFPLGGSRCSSLKTSRNVMIVFLVSGLWHGAAWTFVIWGALHGLFLVIERLFKIDRVKAYVRYPIMLLALILAWVAFRAESLGSMIEFWKGMVIPQSGEVVGKWTEFLTWIAIMFLGEYLLTLRGKPLVEKVMKYVMIPYIKWPIYLYLICKILHYHPSDSLFIYAQF